MRERSSLLFSLILLLAATGHATPPFAPGITEPPTNGTVVSPFDVHMETAPFSDPDSGDTHFCSDFEIWDDAVTELVWRASCLTGPGKIHTHLGDGVFTNSLGGQTKLLFDAPYELRVRHQDDTAEWSPYAVRTFQTGPPTVVFPLELSDVLDSPAPVFTDAGGAPLFLPTGAPPASIRLETAGADLLLAVTGPAAISNPPALSGHAPLRVRMEAGSTGQNLVLPLSHLSFFSDDGEAVTIYLPALSLAGGTQAVFWVSENGSSYAGVPSQTEPDFSTLAQGAPVPWTVMEPGYRVEVFATGLRLPVNIAFVPDPGPGPGDVLFYVTELYGDIRSVTRGGTVIAYATNLLNYDPLGGFPGSGEQGLAGIAVDPVSGDVFASMLYDDGGPHYPKIMRFHSEDGGLTAAAPLAHDVAADARHGLYEGEPLLNQPGADAGTSAAVAFDGTNDFIAFADPLDFGDAFSILMWVRPGGASNIQALAANTDGGDSDGFKFFLNSFASNDGAVLFENGDGVAPNDHAFTAGGAVIETNAWVHVAVTVDRAAGAAEIYVNGAQRTMDGSVSTNFGVRRAWRLGRFTDDGFPLQGRLDDVQIYGRALSSNEVSALYAAPGSATSNRLAHYPLDEPALTRRTILDMAGEMQGASHQISNLSFGPDGRLYAHVGDGFDASTALNTNSFRGKILRLNAEGSPPPDNPFYDAANGISATDYLYAYGFRNPFGGGWRAADGAHYEVENGPAANDRLARVDAGQSYGWNGSDASMTNRAIYTWSVPHAPVNLVFLETNVFQGSGFPPGKMGHLFVTESGDTYATGPSAKGKRIVEFVLDGGGTLLTGPVTLVEYNGSGQATAVGLAAGPDGLYFTDLYKDQDAASPVERGANVLRVRFVGSADFAADVVAGTPPLAVQFTNLSTLSSTAPPVWKFGDGKTSSQGDPDHTYPSEGIFDVELKVTGSNGISLLRRPLFIRVGAARPALFVVVSTSLEPGDRMISNRLALLGFSPIEIRTDAGVISGDATGKAVVVISSSVASDLVGNKFTGVPVPVVCWENFLFDNLGLCAVQGIDTGTSGGQTQLSIATNGHFLAAGLAGSVTVVNTGHIFSWGRPNSNAVVAATLATQPDYAAIFAYESNAVMVAGTAPARRVGFFLENLTAVNLTHAGEQLFDAAVLWAIGRDQDSDGDGAADLLDVDDDGDGLLDHYEDTYGLDRLDPADATLDSDGDGVINLEEAKADSEPLNSNSVLRLTLDPGPSVTWSGREDVVYQVQGSAAIVSQAWENVQLPLTPAEHGLVTVTNPVATNLFYYRLLLP